MKKAFLLSALLGGLLTIVGCANQNHPTAANTSSQRGLVGPGSVAPVNGGPARPGPIHQRYEP